MYVFTTANSYIQDNFGKCVQIVNGIIISSVSMDTVPITFDTPSFQISFRQTGFVKQQFRIVFVWRVLLVIPRRRFNTVIHQSRCYRSFTLKNLRELGNLSVLTDHSNLEFTEYLLPIMLTYLNSKNRETISVFPYPDQIPTKVRRRMNREAENEAVVVGG